MTRIIGKRYELFEPIGQGGMATVFRGYDNRLQRDVAVKVLLKPPEDEESLFYFHREARAMAKLEHANIVPILDYSGPDELPAYIVMRLVRGTTVQQALIPAAPLPAPVVLAVLMGLSEALAFAHKAGVIHRDLKPANIMLENDGQLYLTDFGLAKAHSNDSLLGQTVAGQQTSIFGTPDFMAPEQVLAAYHGPETDVFSLGSVGFYLATGSLPFAAASPMEVMKRISTCQRGPLEQGLKHTHGDLRRLIMGCMNPDRHRRLRALTLAKAAKSVFEALDSRAPKAVLAACLGSERCDTQDARDAQNPADEWSDPQATQLIDLDFQNTPNDQVIVGATAMLPTARRIPGGGSRRQSSRRSFKAVLAGVAGALMLGVLGWLVWPSSNDVDMSTDTGTHESPAERGAELDQEVDTMSPPPQNAPEPEPETPQAQDMPVEYQAAEPPRAPQVAPKNHVKTTSKKQRNE